MIDELDGLVKPVAAMERIIQDQKGIYWQLFWHGYRLRLGGKDKGLWFVKHYDDPVGGDAERHDAIRRMNDHHRERILSALNPDAIEALRSAPDVGEARMVEAVGSTRAEMVRSLTTDDVDFWRLGDAKLMWVNEGDIANGIVRRALADQTKEAGDGHR